MCGCICFGLSALPASSCAGFGVPSHALVFVLLIMALASPLCLVCWGSSCPKGPCGLSHAKNRSPGARWTFAPVKCQSWILPVLLCLSCRVGEARKPGPEWQIAVANTNGLNSRAFSLVDSPYEVWLFSETHLTKTGAKVFWSNLRGTSSGFVSFLTGCPVAPRSESSEIGQWSGVGVLSKFPARRLPHAWSPSAYNSGRLVCSAFCAFDLWVSGVVVYGTPTGPTHLKGKEVTNDLLAQALDRIEQSTGPRFIAGDFNHDWDTLEVIAKMHRLGYRDIQDLHAERTGCLPQATCRGKTRRDFLFVSRELAALFVSCSLDDNVVADHSYLVGKFQGGTTDLCRFAWPVPDPMAWEPVERRHSVAVPLFRDAGSLTADYAKFWELVESSNMEARAAQRKPQIRSMTGRGRQMAPTPRVANLPPLKASRPGDRQPVFMGSCLQHAQWTKQLRRLQSYVRLCQSQLPSSAHRAHQLQLWTSIRSAAGFVPDFASWWSSRNLCVGEPACVPLAPPGFASASLFYVGLESELSQLESALKAARSHANRLAKASDAHAMYQAVRRDVPAQVDSLALQLSTTVSEVDESECAVVTVTAVPWRSDAPILHDSKPLEVIHAEDDKLWLQSCHNIQPGDQLTQRRLVGRLQELFDAFESQWAKLWNRHDNVPDSQWDQILDFARRSLRPVSAELPAITPESIRATLQRKSRHAATGLDGVSRSDLLALTPDDLSLLCQVYQHATESGAWPDQVLKGYVRSLAKVEDACEVGHFRPITVFSNVYRSWSSVAARHWLRHLSGSVDSFLCGNTSGGRAAMVWRYMLERVEQAHKEGEEVCGFSADIVKAFNILPRYPALTAAKLMGVDHGTLVAWAGALNGFVRHFVVQGSFSPGVQSGNGFPEGCALSCLAMLTLTQLFHRWMTAANMMFQPISYVDNWGVLLQSVDYMQQACDAVDSFAQALQLDIDAAKSYCWATSSVGRRQLRQAGFSVRLKHKELGAHVVFSKQLSNHHALERLRQLDDFWSKLTSCSCTFQQKITLVQRVAWPRAFHAVSAVVVGRKHFEALRTSVMQALRLQKPGANPELQCSLEGDLFDPMVFSAVETLRDARTLRHVQLSSLDFTQALFGDGQPEFNTLNEILCQRLHKLGFSVKEDALVEDALGSFDFLACALPEFVLRAQWTWTLVLASAVRHRRTFAGFASVDLPATRLAYKQFDQYDQGILRKFLHGATLTNEHAQHWSDDASACCLRCGQPDSTRHRLWECSATEDLRASIPVDVRQDLQTQPMVVTEHGWILRSPLAPAWFKYLLELPAQPSFQPAQSREGILDLFTDGSCLWPSEPAFRLASWAVVQAPPFDMSDQRASFMPIAAQPLSGLIQTAYRAELTAVIAAIQFAMESRSYVRVWTDCQSVVDAFKAFILDGRAVPPNRKNADLLLKLQDVVAQLGSSKVAVLKVPAHKQRQEFESDLDKWLIDGNNAVDQAALAANRARPCTMWNLWNAYVAQVVQHRNVAGWVHQHMLAVSKLWNQSLSSDVVVGPKQSRPVRPSRVQPVLQWDDPNSLTLKHPTFGRFFGVELASDVQAWLRSIRDPAQEIRPISFLQLYISFQRHQGPWMIRKIQGSWVAEKGNLALLANHVNLNLRVKFFRLMVQQFLRDAEVRISKCTERPYSQWIACFRGCMGFSLAHAEYEAIERVLANGLSAPATGSGGALSNLRGV